MRYLVPFSTGLPPLGPVLVAYFDVHLLFDGVQKGLVVGEPSSLFEALLYDFLPTFPVYAESSSCLEKILLLQTLRTPVKG